MFIHQPLTTTMNLLQTLTLLLTIVYLWPSDFLQNSCSGLNPVFSTNENKAIPQINSSPNSTMAATVMLAGSACTGVPGPNLIFNGDFGSGPSNVLPGNPGYAPAPYTYTTNPPPNDGTYTVTSNTTWWGDFAQDSWINIYNNSPDTSGYMMVVNGSETPGLFYENGVSVCENMTYEFSCDVISMNRPAISAGFSKPNISFMVNGVEMFVSGDVPIDSAWHTYSFTFTTTPGTSSLSIGLVNNTPGGAANVGNDFAIDNVILRTCGPMVTLEETTNPPYCPNDLANIKIHIGPGLDSPVWQWQFSTNGGTTWMNIGLVQNMPQVPLFMGGLQIDLLIRAIVAETNSGLTSPGCNFISDTIPINVHPNSDVFLAETICLGQSYTVGNSTFTATGLYEIPLVSFTGCDSIVHLDLTVTELMTVDFAIICEGDPYTFGTQTLTASGVYDENFTTADGCDSLVTLTLEVWDSFLFQQNETLCAGKLYNGVPVFSDTSFLEVYSTWQGCDSTFMTNIQVLDSFIIENNFSICMGDPVNGIPIWSDTTWTVPLQTWQGCDSTFVWTVTVTDSVMMYQNISLCKGEIFHGVPVFSDTTWIEASETPAGCDSTVIWSIMVSDSFLIQQNLELCQGSTSNGVPAFSDTTWIEFFQSSGGCDSTVVTNISILGELIDTQELTACYGDLLNGIPLVTATVIVIQNTGANGCDSNTVYVVTVEPPLDLNISGGTSLCDNTVTTLSAGNFDSYTWSTNATSQSIEVSAPGTYAVTVTSANGCTGSNSITVTGGLAAMADFSDPHCAGDNNGQIEVVDVEGTAPFQYALNGGFSQASPVFPDLPPGSYDLTVTDAGGCVYEETIVLVNPEPLLLDPGDDSAINLGESVALQPATNALNATWLWEPSTGLTCSDCPAPVASPAESIVYTIVVTDGHNCRVSAKLTVTVNKNQQLYIPNAFSPNDDGINDFFTIYAGKGVETIRQFEVFDRWGNHVFSAPPNSPPGSPELQWDGTAKGKKLQPGAFTWFAKIEFKDGRIEQYEGGIMLVH